MVRETAAFRQNRFNPPLFLLELQNIKLRMSLERQGPSCVWFFSESKRLWANSSTLEQGLFPPLGGFDDKPVNDDGQLVL